MFGKVLDIIKMSSEKAACAHLIDGILIIWRRSHHAGPHIYLGFVRRYEILTQTNHQKLQIMTNVKWVQCPNALGCI